MSLVCRFELFCSEEKFKEHGPNILHLGFSIAKIINKNCKYSCEITNPTRDQVNKFLDVFERIQDPKKDGRYTDDEEDCQSFVVLNNLENFNFFGNREPEEGVEEDDEKTDSLTKDGESFHNVGKNDGLADEMDDKDCAAVINEGSYKDFQIVYQDQVPDLKEYEEETRRNLFENDEGQTIVNDFGQSEKLNNFDQNVEKRLDETKEDDVSSTQTDVNAAQGKYYSKESCHENMTQYVPNPNKPFRVSENERTLAGIEEKNNDSSSELKSNKQLQDKEDADDKMEHDIKTNAKSEDMVDDMPKSKPRQIANQRKYKEASDMKQMDPEGENLVMNMDMDKVKMETPSNEMCNDLNYESTPNDIQLTETEDNCCSELDKKKERKFQSKSMDIEENVHQKVPHGFDERKDINEHCSDCENSGGGAVKSFLEGVDEERRNIVFYNVDNVEVDKVSQGANELKVENMSGENDEIEKNIPYVGVDKHSGDDDDDDDDDDDNHLDESCKCKQEGGKSKCLREKEFVLSKSEKERNWAPHEGTYPVTGTSHDDDNEKESKGPRENDFAPKSEPEKNILQEADTCIDIDSISAAGTAGCDNDDVDTDHNLVDEHCNCKQEEKVSKKENDVVISKSEKHPKRHPEITSGDSDNDDDDHDHDDKVNEDNKVEDMDNDGKLTKIQRFDDLSTSREKNVHQKLTCNRSVVDDADMDEEENDGESLSKGQRKNHSLISNPGANKKDQCYDGTADGNKDAKNDAHVDEDYKGKQEDKEIICEIAESEHDDDDGDDDFLPCDDGSDDKDDGEERKGKNVSIPFEKGEYELALIFFSNSTSLKYLNKPEVQRSMMIIKVDDEQCINELISFKSNLKQVKITTDKHEMLRKVQKRWETQIVIEPHSEYFLLTAFRELHAKMKDTFPSLYNTEASCQISTANMFKEQAECGPVNGLGEDRGEDKMNATYRIDDDTFGGHNLIVKIENADITKLHVDVIVNAANYRLRNTGGVARKIAEAAGRKLTDECTNFISMNSKIAVTQHFSSSGGNLHSKEVYHAVGPKFLYYIDQLDRCKRDLRLTILKCLCHAESDGYHSIAFPSISAALFQVPKEICVESYMKAVQHFEYIREPYSKNLEKVYFVDVDDSMVEAVKQHFTQNWDSSINRSDFEFRRDEMEMTEYYFRYGHDNAGSSGASSVGAKSITSRFRSWFGGSNSDEEEPKSTDNCSGSKWSPKLTQTECEICYQKRSDFRRFQCCDKKVCKNCHQKMQRCPYCMKIYGILTGDQPKGCMIVVKRDIDLAGYKSNTGCYVISYFFDEISHLSPYRDAYIPSTSDGQFAIKLLLLAFHRRLIFTKGRSVTTGRENQIVWNDIHHKTTLKKNDSYGYPDNSYLNRLSDELKSKGVTKDSMTPDEVKMIKHCVKELKQKYKCTLYCDG